MTIADDTLPTLPFLHQDQPDRPNTVYPSSLALKQAFDSSTQALQAVHNALVADLLSATSGSSGAESIGSATISGVLGNTVYNQLVDLKAQIQSLVGGVIPPSSVTTAMLQDGSVTTPKLANNAVTFAKLSTDMETASVGGQMYAYRNLLGGF